MDICSFEHCLRSQTFRIISGNARFLYLGVQNEGNDNEVSDASRGVKYIA